MIAPLRSNPRPRPPRLKESNADPKKLDSFYQRMLGDRGDRMLSEETKWLAVTHKSFDHGRRGFNERLAFLGGLQKQWDISYQKLTWYLAGKRIVELQASLGLLLKPPSSLPSKDPYGRNPFKHTALEGLGALDSATKDELTHPKQVARAARSYGIEEVVRWTPRRVRSPAPTVDSKLTVTAG